MTNDKFARVRALLETLDIVLPCLPASAPELVHSLGIFAPEIRELEAVYEHRAPVLGACWRYGPALPDDISQPFEVELDKMSKEFLARDTELKRRCRAAALAASWRHN